MEGRICYLAIILIAFIHASGAQPATAQYTDLGTNPLSLIFGSLKVTGEHPVGPSGSIEWQAAYLLPSNRFWTASYKSRGVRVGLSYLLYFDATGEHEGLYAFAYTRLGRIDYRDDDTVFVNFRDVDLRQNRWSVGVGLGYKRFVNDHLFLGAALGGGRAIYDDYRITTPGANGDEDTLGPILEQAFAVYGRIAFGYRFAKR